MTAARPDIAGAVPVLETERLRLRPLAEADLDALTAFYASDRARYYGDLATRSEVWKQMAAFAGSWLLKGFGPWALEERETGRLAGLCGPWAPPRFPEPEITWALFDGFEGRGYATEAARASLDFAHDRLGWETAVSCIHPDNARSIRLAERLGARFDYAWDADGEPLHIYRHAGPGAGAREAVA